MDLIFLTCIWELERTVGRAEGDALRVLGLSLTDKVRLGLLCLLPPAEGSEFQQQLEKSMNGVCACVRVCLHILYTDTQTLKKF